MFTCEDRCRCSRERAFHRLVFDTLARCLNQNHDVEVQKVLLENTTCNIMLRNVLQIANVEQPFF